MGMHEYQSICLCVGVCLQPTPLLIPTFSPDFPSVKNCGCVLTCSSLYPWLNLLFMLLSPNLMGLSVCLSFSSSHPYQGSTKMTFWRPLPVFPLSQAIIFNWFYAKPSPKWLYKYVSLRICTCWSKKNISISEFSHDIITCVWINCKQVQMLLFTLFYC